MRDGKSLKRGRERSVQFNSLLCDMQRVLKGMNLISSASSRVRDRKRKEMGMRERILLKKLGRFALNCCCERERKRIRRSVEKIFL